MSQAPEAEDTRTRQDFKALLESVSSNAMVVGQAPGNTSMTYPAIRYEKDDEDVQYGDNVPYNITDRYLVTVMEYEPDTPVAKLVRQLPLCSFNRAYVESNLNHTVYTIYF